MTCRRRVVTLLAVPGLGPRTAGDLWRQAGIASLDELEAAAATGRLRSIRGISEKTEAEAPRRPRASCASGRPVACAWDAAADIVDRVSRAVSCDARCPAVVVAGSFRRRRETVGDLDVLVETDNPAEVIDRLHSAAWVERVGGHGGRPGGTTRTTVQLRNGPQLDVMTMPPGSAGTYLVHFTGSAAHNVRLREIARDRGWSL